MSVRVTKKHRSPLVIKYSKKTQQSNGRTKILFLERVAINLSHSIVVIHRSLIRQFLILLKPLHCASLHNYMQFLGDRQFELEALNMVNQRIHNFAVPPWRIFHLRNILSHIFQPSRKVVAFNSKTQPATDI